MKKFFILLLLTTYIFYSSTEKLNIKKKNFKLSDQADGHNYPGNIVESVQSDVPNIKIRFAGAEEAGDDDADATISIDNESEEEEDNDDDDQDVPIRKKKIPKSKPEDIHTFL